MDNSLLRRDLPLILTVDLFPELLTGLLDLAATDGMDAIHKVGDERGGIEDIRDSGPEIVGVETLDIR